VADIGRQKEKDKADQDGFDPNNDDWRVADCTEFGLGLE
jgi:hypothetical protein